MKILYTAEQVQQAVCRLAGEIERHFGTDEDVTVLALLNGALWFAADLLRALPQNFLLETARVSSYGDARSSSGTLQWKTPMPDVRGKRVLIVDDVLDTGLTLQQVGTTLREAGASEVRTAVLVLKEGCQKVPISADFTALTAPKLFLIGCGMDDAGRYRNLPYIAEVTC